MSPSLRDPVCHEARNRERGRYRGSFKIRGFPCLILRQNGDCDVESRQSRQSAKNEKAKQEVIDRGADANGKCDRSGGNSKRDLSISKLATFRYSLYCDCDPTRSAKESSSCPIKDDFFRHLATRPSMKSKKRPNGIKISAAHNGAVSSGFVK